MSDLLLCRICWNTNRWERPSGKTGKSRSDSHENSYGYGHEEWLFRTEWLIDGWHYGFVQPMNSKGKKYLGKPVDLMLYTVNSYNSTTKLKYWVGPLRSVYKITEEEAAHVVDQYIENGWFEQMVQEVATAGGDADTFRSLFLSDAFNVVNCKFKPEAINGVYEKPLLIEDAHNPITSYRYQLMALPEDVIETNVEAVLPDFDFNKGHSSLESVQETLKRTFEQHTQELPTKHDPLQSAFLSYLQDQHGKRNVKCECPAAEGTAIDVVRKTDEGYIFYEVKTYNHVKSSLRVAIGQLLEYCCYPNAKHAIKLIVVTDIPPDKKTIQYIRRIQDVLNIPFGFIQFDIATNTIVKEL